jgi:hypothetical protein
MQMIRLIYKAILISIISSVLMVHDLAAFAADTKGKVTKNADGVYEKKNSYQMEDVSDDDGAVSIITMLAIGVIGTKLLMYKKWTMDMTVAAVASAAYLAGEVLNMFQTKEKLEKTNVDVTFREDGKVDSKQVEYINKLKESYQKTMESLETKKKFQMGAFYGFLGAAAVAAYMMFTEEGMYASCEAAILQSNATLASCAASGAVANPEAPSCATCATQIGLLAADLKGIKLVEVKLGPSVAQNAQSQPVEAKAAADAKTPCAGPISTSAKASVMGACSAYLAKKFEGKAFGIMSAVGQNNILNKILFPAQKIVVNKKMSDVEAPAGFKAYLKKSLEIVFPSARAGWVSLLGLGAGAAAVYFGLEKTLGIYIDQYLFTPKWRIAIWGALALLCKVAMGATDDKIEQIKKNIEKLDKILAETAKLQQGIQNANAKVNTVSIVNKPINGSDEIISNTDKTGCLAGSKDSKCNSLQAITTSASGFAGMPTGLQDMVTDMAKTGDGLSGTGKLSSTTLGQISNLGNKAGAVSKLLKKQQIAINDLLKNNKKPAFNFNDEAKKTKNALGKVVTDSLKNRGTTPAGFLGSMGMSVPASSEIEKSADGIIKKSSGVEMTPATGSAANKDLLDLGLKDEGSGDAGLLANGAKEGSAGDEYDIKGNDINSEKGPSIFDIISSRYLKSGYPKLLEEIK